MKKIVIFSLAVVLLFSFDRVMYAQDAIGSAEPQPTEAPGEDFDSLYKSYQTTFEEYKAAREGYVLKRSQYLRFKTLNARQEAIEASSRMISAADSTVIFYLMALTTRLKDAIGVSDDVASELTAKIGDEILWFHEHRENLASASTLEELEADSKKADDRFTALAPLAYQALSEMSYGRVSEFSQRMEEIFKAVREKLEIIRSDKREGYSFSDKKFELLDRWVFQIEGEMVRSKEKLEMADKDIAKIATSGRGALEAYDQIISELRDSQLSLKEAASFLKEVIREIKTSES